ncbi:hypothetical protein NFI96_026195 [Prochilodus magdalenae]|nr:hypothetical protein NFI96_026195 [Prochilodus magdalenae]
MEESENDSITSDFVSSIECDVPVSYVKGVIEGTVVPMLIDSGSSVSLISAELRMSIPALRSRPLKKDYVAARAVNGQMLDTLGTISIVFCLGSDSWQHTFHVLRETTQAVLLGWDFLVKNHALLDITHARLQLWGANIPKDLTPVCCNVSIATAMTLPSLSEVMVPVNVCPPGPSGAYSSDFVGYLEPNIPDTTNLVVAHTVTSVKNGLTCARLLNPTKNDIVLQQGTHLGEFYSVDESDLESLPSTTADLGAGVHPPSDPVTPPVSLEGAPISSSQKAALSALLLRHKDVFNTCNRNTGKCTLVKHHIRTGNQPPIKQRAYRTSPEKRAEIERQVGELLADGVIEESYSPWASPVVLVKKKCGRWRFCVDYRRLNSVTVKDCHPLPRIDDTLDALAGAAWFSTLDFSNGYWQVEVAEEDREKTAFTTGRGLYQWRSMPMGLSNSPATFQRMMELVLRGLPWNICMVYLDDILLYNGTFQDHLSSLEEVFSRIKMAGLKLNPSKCHLAQNHVLFLGHIVSQNGLQPDPRNTDKVKNWPTPQSPSEVRAFVGLCSYYRRFVHNFAKHAAPLNHLMGKNVPFEWTVSCEASFNYLKSVLSSAPVVALPDFSVPFKVFTDASKVAVGAVLAQEREGREHVVAYASQSLNQTQRRWSTFDRELWAIVWAVREFRHYIGLTSFTIITDHRPLLSLRRTALDNDPTGRRGRWILELEPYNWDIVHKDGQRHMNADALSRRPERDCLADSNKDCTKAVVGINTIHAATPGPQSQGPLPHERASTSSENGVVAGKKRKKTSDLSLLLGLAPDVVGIKALQEADGDIGVVLNWMESSQKPPRARMKGASRSLRKLWTEFDRLEVLDGLLCRSVISSLTGEQLMQVVVPAALVPEVLQQLHGGSTSAHFAAERVWEQARQICYWPSMFRDIRDWCEQCKACQRRRSPVPPHRAQMGSSSTARPFERVAADLVELPVTTRGNRYVLVVEDYFTKFVNLYALANQTAQTVAQCLFGDYVLVHGVPERLHSDQGRQFEAEVVQCLCRLLGITKTRTTPYNPKSDGMVERFNKTLIEQLTRTLLHCGGEWDEYVKQVAFAYNTSVHSSTHFTPYYLTHGREARVPAEVLIPSRAVGSQTSTSYVDFVSSLKEKLEVAFSRARMCGTEAHERQKLYHDEKARHKPYKVGAMVWLNNPVESRMKLAPHWKGPYQVLQVMDSGGVPGLTYRIASPFDCTERQQVVHYDRLRPYTLPVRLPQQSQHSDPSLPPSPGFPEPVCSHPGQNDSLVVSTKTKAGLVTEDDPLPFRSAMVSCQTVMELRRSMTVWHDTIAVFGDVDVVLRGVVVMVCVHVVLRCAGVWQWNRPSSIPRVVVVVEEGGGGCLGVGLPVQFVVEQDTQVFLGNYQLNLLTHDGNGADRGPPPPAVHHHLLIL